MPLSEGATRAGTPAGSLQRVLDYAPDGTTIHPIVRIGRHAAEGIIEAAGEQEADLIIFGWGGKAAPLRSARAVAGGTTPGGTTPGGTAQRAPPRARPDRAPSSRRRSTRSFATRRATSPWSSSAAPARSDGSSSRSAAGPTRSWRCASPTPSHAPRRDGRGPAPRPARESASAVRAQAERALAAFVRQHLHGPQRGDPARGPNIRNAILREAERVRPRGHGRVGPAGRRRRPELPVRCPAGSHRGAGEGVGHRGQDARARSSGTRSTSSPRGPKRSPPPIAPPRKGGPFRSGWSAGSVRPTSTTPNSPTCAGWSSSRRSRG